MDGDRPTMRVARISPHIWQVRLGWISPVHVWLVAADDGLTLVDSGYWFMAGDVIHAVDLIDAGPLRRIVLTHGHPDHAGGAAKVAQARHVPVYAHRLELPFLEGERTYPRINRVLQPIRPGLARALPEFTDGTLEPLGGLTPWSTPGHTPGHVVYHHVQDDVLLAGDLFKARNGQLHHLGHFYSVDPERARRSEQILQLLQPTRVEASHGGSVLRPTTVLPPDPSP